VRVFEQMGTKEAKRVVRGIWVGHRGVIAETRKDGIAEGIVTGRLGINGYIGARRDIQFDYVL
jgi:hypothetical protein